MRGIIVMLWIGAMAAIVLALAFVSTPPSPNDSLSIDDDGYSIFSAPDPNDPRLSLMNFQIMR